MGGWMDEWMNGWIGSDATETVVPAKQYSNDGPGLRYS